MAVPELAIIDVGHGNSAVVTHESGVVVIDTGKGDALLQFLLERGIKEIDEVLLSHADADHIGGLVALLSVRNVKVKMVRLNTDSQKASALWDDMLYALDRQGVQWAPSLTPQDNAALNRGDLKVEVLAPSRYLAGKVPGGQDRKRRRLSSNSVSAVLRVLVSGLPRALLAGDLDGIGLDNLLESVADNRKPSGAPVRGDRLRQGPHGYGRAPQALQLRPGLQRGD